MPARKPKKTTFHEGEEAAKRFDSMMDAVLSVPKSRILEIEKAGREKKSAAKKKKS